MAQQTVDQLKQWFETGDFPTQQQFWDWLDSYWNKGETIPIDQIQGLRILLNALSMTGIAPPVILDPGVDTWFVPAGTFIHALVPIDDAEIAISIGSTSGDDDLVDEFTVDPLDPSYRWGKYFKEAQDIYFNGVGPDTVIKIYRA